LNKRFKILINYLKHNAQS